ncbi:MAG: DUF2029 domain-containing protein [Candidatus Brocadiaceae bacterium]|nr:DUF2029 domain-containing protein [Candidatus Brocadiaceae bacterium]
MLEKRKFIVLLIIASSFLVLTYFHSITKMVFVEKNFCDFAGYYFYADLLNNDKDIYLLTRDKNLGEEHKQLMKESGIPVHIAFGVGYSPLFFYLISFLAKLKFTTANLVWLIANNLLVIATMMLWIFMRRDRDSYLFFTSIIVMFASQPLLENMGAGQVNVIFLFLFLLVAYLYNEKREYLCGPALAFVLLLKPQWGLISLFFLWKRSYTVVTSTIISYIVFRIFGILLYGFDIEASYWQSLFYQSQTQTGDIMDLSLKGVVDRIFLGLLPEQMKIASVLHKAVSLALIVLTFKQIPRIKNSNESLLEYAVVISLVAIISPKTLEHHLVPLFIPFVILLEMLNIGNIRNIVLLTAAFCLVSVRYSLNSISAFHVGLPAILTAGKIAGVFILWWLLMKTLSPKYKDCMQSLP